MERLDELVTNMAGFDKAYIVTGQTYSRKLDLDILNTLGSLGASIHKVCMICKKDVCIFLISIDCFHSSLRDVGAILWITKGIFMSVLLFI